MRSTLLPHSLFAACLSLFVATSAFAQEAAPPLPPPDTTPAEANPAEPSPASAPKTSNAGESTESDATAKTAPPDETTRDRGFLYGAGLAGGASGNMHSGWSVGFGAYARGGFLLSPAAALYVEPMAVAGSGVDGSFGVAMYTSVLAEVRAGDVLIAGGPTVMFQCGTSPDQYTSRNCSERAGAGGVLRVGFVDNHVRKGGGFAGAIDLRLAGGSDVAAFVGLTFGFEGRR